MVYHPRQLLYSQYSVADYHVALCRNLTRDTYIEFRFALNQISQQLASVDIYSGYGCGDCIVCQLGRGLVGWR